jgi:hypothetical protein
MLGIPYALASRGAEDGCAGRKKGAKSPPGQIIIRIPELHYAEEYCYYIAA